MQVGGSVSLWQDNQVTSAETNQVKLYYSYNINDGGDPTKSFVLNKNTNSRFGISFIQYTICQFYGVELLTPAGTTIDEQSIYITDNSYLGTGDSSDFYGSDYIFPLNFDGFYSVSWLADDMYGKILTIAGDAGKAELYLSKIVILGIFCDHIPPTLNAYDLNDHGITCLEFNSGTESNIFVPLQTWTNHCLQDYQSVW